MSWKRYFNMFAKRDPDETHFILGVDLGNDSSSLAFYNPMRKTAEILDISGGYGRASSPTVVQFLPDNNEWVFGEYAVLNNGDGRELTFANIMSKLGNSEYVNVGARSFSIEKLLSLYLKEFIGGIRNINPKAEIAGIIASVNGYLSADARKELTRAFSMAGFDGELIGLSTDRVCALSYVLYQSEFFQDKRLPSRILYLDCGSRELRAAIYKIKPAADRVKSAEDRIKSADGLEAVSEFSMFDPQLGAGEIDKSLITFLQKRLPRENHNIQRLNSFLYQHKDMMLQKNNWRKPIKLYLNFVYPPIQITVTQAQMAELISPFRARLNNFIRETLEKSEYNQPTAIDSVICVGGGFEMQWLKDEIQTLFSKETVSFFKNPKAVVAEGAAILAARSLGVAELPFINVIDHHQINSDLGLMIYSGSKETFLPIIERGAFWWQTAITYKFILKQQAEMSIDLWTRNADGERFRLAKIPLDGLNLQSKGAKAVTRLALDINFERFNILKATVTDCGFGEIFPATGFTKTISLKYNI
ncbi:MAG: DUF5716 family protein [Clostridiales bacterium]|jgi:molecular chaperone DnaK (HSP70)|nr:DUF5716 family protein [Clostridiales bacterium]